MTELSKATLFGLMLEQLQFPARNRNRNRNPSLRFKGNTRGLRVRLRLRLRKMEELGLRVPITISTDFTEVCYEASFRAVSIRWLLAPFHGSRL